MSRDKRFSITELVEKPPEELDADTLRLLVLFAREYPEAQQIEFETFPPEDDFDAGGFYRIQEFPDSVVPVIFISEGKHEQLEPLLKIRKTSIALNASLLGISPDLMSTRLLHKWH